MVIEHSLLLEWDRHTCSRLFYKSLQPVHISLSYPRGVQVTFFVFAYVGVLLFGSVKQGCAFSVNHVEHNPLASMIPLLPTLCHMSEKLTCR